MVASQRAVNDSGVASPLHKSPCFAISRLMATPSRADSNDWRDFATHSGDTQFGRPCGAKLIVRIIVVQPQSYAQIIPPVASSLVTTCELISQGGERTCCLLAR